jgi:hypothetical protein
MVDGKTIYGPSLDGKWFMAIDCEYVVGRRDMYDTQKGITRVEFEEVER